ncbi:hypothetical protein BDW74DRAFT_172062 [Aspergillus multicolor]|uniref:uncharacterized protein n=1 Tax=Aspergillus multicolor TaxID=41759 RepID=UPI003CCD43C1
MSDNKASELRGPSSASSSPSKPTEAQTKTKPQQPSPQTSSASASAWPGLGANFAHDPKAPFTVNYDQEIYLQFMAAEEGTDTTGTGTGPPDLNKAKKNKTPKQIYREEWVRRALNPAISDPRGEPSPSDFEYAESQRIRERF